MTARQQKALAALLSTSSKAAAARAAGISDRTLRDYLADPTFRAEYEKAFKDMVEDATRQAITINFTGDLAQLGRVLKPIIDTENQRIGPGV